MFSLGDLTIEDSVLTNNKADGAGGGAVTDGTVGVRRTSVVGNSTDEGGGGLQGKPRRHRDRLERLRTTSTVGSPPARPTPRSSRWSTRPSTTTRSQAWAAASSAVVTHRSPTSPSPTTPTTNFANLFVTDNLRASALSSRVGGAGNCLAGPDSVSLGYNFSDDDTCRFTAPTDRGNAGRPAARPARIERRPHAVAAAASREPAARHDPGCRVRCPASPPTNVASHGRRPAPATPARSKWRWSRRCR